MYAVVKSGSRQYRVQADDEFEVDRLDKKEGSQVSLKEVLLLHDGKELHIGQPKVKGASVVCNVLEHPRGKKLIAFRFRRTDNVRRKRGFRAALTRLKVKEIKFEKAETS